MTTTTSRNGARGRRHVGAVLVATVLLAVGGVGRVEAMTTPSCLAKKLKEWGKLRKCQATENGKALQAKPADLAKCQTMFDTKLAAISVAATAGAIACRYGVNGDGTATDYRKRHFMGSGSAIGLVIDHSII